MTPKYVYIDSENVGLAFFDTLEKMDSSWTAYIFYTDKSPRVPMEYLARASKLKCRLEAVGCTNGTPNALDFCLMVSLGASLTKRPKSLHFIVSNDRGYDAAIHLMTNHGFRLGRCTLPSTSTELAWVQKSVSEKEYKELLDVFSVKVIDTWAINRPLIEVDITNEITKLSHSASSTEKEDIPNVVAYTLKAMDTHMSKDNIKWEFIYDALKDLALFKSAPVGKQRLNTYKMHLVNLLRAYKYELSYPHR